MGIAAAVVAVVMLASVGCTLETTSRPAHDTPHVVTYRVTGSADVSYTSETGGMSTDHSLEPLGLRGPWVKSIQVTREGMAWLSAQSEMGVGVKAEILENGVVVKSATCTGQYCIAQVSWSAR